MGVSANQFLSHKDISAYGRTLGWWLPPIQNGQSNCAGCAITAARAATFTRVWMEMQFDAIQAAILASSEIRGGW